MQRAGLTPSEQRIGMLVLTGLANGEIAERIGRAEDTVKDHLRACYRKTGTYSRAHFVACMLGYEPARQERRIA